MEPTDRQYRNGAATHSAVSEGDIEVDRDGQVSRSDGGAYVQAWIWVADEVAVTQPDLVGAAKKN